MMSLLRRFGVLVFAGATLFGSEAAFAQTVTVTGTGSTIVVNFTSGHSTARADAMRRAAQIWADTLQSAVTIEVDISFEVLTCNASSAVLGSAGPNTASRSFANAPVANTWYPIALANALSGQDLNGGTAEITAAFNSALDDPARDQTCLRGIDWFYGTGAPPSGTIGFFDVVLHEIAHGLGFLSYADLSTGALLQGFDDHYTRNLEDDSAARALTAAGANNAQRATAFTDNGDLVWTGSAVTAAGVSLSNGVNSGQVQMYAPTTVRPGSSVSHFDTALDPNELMEPSYTNLPGRDLTIALFQDIGWSIVANNVAPVITGARALSTAEDTPLTLALGDFTVTDPDNNYPTGFTLAVDNGANYSAAGAVVTPAANYVGNLFVPVRVNDGTSDSATFTATVAVSAVNDPPTITAQANLQTNEDTAIGLSLANFTISDPDSSTFTLTFGAGTNYTVTGTVVTPAANFFGNLLVPVTPNDGTVNGPTFTATVAVAPVNDPPVVTAGPGPLMTNEDVPITVPIAGFTVTDPDDSFPADFTLEIAPGMGFTAVGAVVTPDANQSGMLTLSVSVNDGEVSSNAVAVPLTVAPVNDPPIITGPAQLGVDEDDALTLGVADFMIQDPDSAAATFAVRIDPGTNYTVMGNTLRPATDFVGTLMVAVVPSDGMTDGPTYTLPVVVRPIPDAPRIIGQRALEMDEDTSLTLALADFEILDPDSPASSFTLSVINGPEYTFAGNTVTPRQDLDDVLLVRVVVNDGGLDSDPYTAEIDIRAINDPPQILGHEPLSVLENRPLTIELEDLVIVDPDSETFTVQVADGPGYTRSGTTITPTMRGLLRVPVTVSDGALTSPPFEVEVAVGENTVSPVIVTEATGLYTRVESPTPPASLGILPGPVTVTLSQGVGEWLRPGRYDIFWRETDGQNEAIARQPLVVRPVIALSSNRRVTEGSVSDMSIVLNGPYPQAGVRVSYLVEGTAMEPDHDLRPGSVTLLSGAVDLPIPIQTIADGITEVDETIQVTLTGDGNLLNGATHQTVITDGPTAPRVAIRATVDGQPSTTVIRGGAPLVLGVEGITTGATLTWRHPQGAVVGGTSEAPSLNLDALSVGGYSVELEAASSGGTTRTQLSLRVVEAAPTLSDMLDSDGDGTADAAEGFGDADGDGVPDYLDPFRIAFALPFTPGFEPPAVVEGRPGARLALGPVAIGAGADGAGVTAEDIGLAPEVTPDTAPFVAAVDVIAPDLVPGDSAFIALTVPAGFPADGQLRIWGTSGWQDFVPGTGERVETTTDDGTCPAPTSDSYRAPRVGHRCLRVSVRDGGPNDRDGQADGRVWILAALGMRTGGGDPDGGTVGMDAGASPDGGLAGDAGGAPDAAEGPTPIGPNPVLEGSGCRGLRGSGATSVLLLLGLCAGLLRARRRI